MQIARAYNYILALMVCFTVTSCSRNGSQLLDDSRSAGRYMNQGFKAFCGQCADSRAVRSRDEFMPMEDYPYDDQMIEFVPLHDENNKAMGEFVSNQPKETPGDPGSSIPGIAAFRDPSSNPTLAKTFRNISFEYNSSLVKGQQSYDTVRNIATYLRSNPNTYVFVEGHCDERGPEAYNLALGARRSNAVRNLLIQEGVNGDQVFTISYGKERPLMHEHTEEAWNQNRRAEFKIYQR